MTGLALLRVRLLTLWVVALLSLVPPILLGCGGGEPSPIGAAGSAGSTQVPEASAPDSMIPDTGPDLTPVPRVATPQFDPPGGTVSGAQTVQIACATAGAAIYYTIDGTTPTQDSPLYLGPIALAAHAALTVRAFARADGYSDSALNSATYVVDSPHPQAAAPTFSPPGGTYSKPQPVAMSSSTPGVDIYYTIDGNDPNQGSVKYTEPVLVSNTTTIKAIAIDPTGYYSPSPISAATHICLTKAAPPIFSLASGTYTTAQTVLLASSTPGAVIHYTVDGTDPDGSSPTLSMSLSIVATTTVRAVAIATGFLDSNISEANYVISSGGGMASPPTMSPPGGTYCAIVDVSLSSTSPGAVIYYTTDGTDPTQASLTYSAPIQVSWSLSIKAVAYAPGFSPSGIATAAYTLSPCLLQATPPTITPNGGSFNAPVLVGIATSEPNGTIIYTTDGTLPTMSNSVVYAAPFMVAVTTTLNAVVTAPAKMNFPPVTATFTVCACGDTVMPVTLTPGTSASTNDIDVILSTATVGATICYTLDGSAPTCATDSSCQSGLTYGGVAVVVTKTGTSITASGCQVGMVPSATSVGTYTLTPAPVVFTPSAGTVPVNTPVTMSTDTIGAEIRYSTDGVDPTCSTGTVYGAAVALTQDTTFHAIACKVDYATAPVSVVPYTVQ